MSPPGPRLSRLVPAKLRQRLTKPSAPSLPVSPPCSTTATRSLAAAGFSSSLLQGQLKDPQRDILARHCNSGERIDERENVCWNGRAGRTPPRCQPRPKQSSSSTAAGHPYHSRGSTGQPRQPNSLRPHDRRDQLFL